MKFNEKEASIASLYMILLGRMPESRGVMKFLGDKSLDYIKSLLISSPEFNDRMKGFNASLTGLFEKNILLFTSDTTEVATRGGMLHPKIKTHYGTHLHINEAGVISHWSCLDGKDDEDDATDEVKCSNLPVDYELIAFDDGTVSIRKGGFFLSAAPDERILTSTARIRDLNESFFMHPNYGKTTVTEVTFTIVPARFGSKGLREVESYEPTVETLLLPRALSKDDIEWFDAYDTNFFPVKAGKRSLPRNVINYGSGKVISARSRCEGVILDETGYYHNMGFLGLRTGTSRYVPVGNAFAFQFAAIAKDLYLPGSYLICFDGNSFNYYHWLLESLLSLVLMRNAGRTEPPLLIIPPSGLSKWQREYLKILNIDEWCEVDGDSVDALLVREAFWLQIRDLHNIGASELVALRDKIFLGLKEITHDGLSKKIYLKRANGARAIKNNEEVESFLCANGFCIILAEALSVEEQIKTFYNASIVVGAHGAGLANILFCKAKTKIVELVPSQEPRNCFWILAEKMQLEYYFGKCESPSGLAGPIDVDIAMLTGLLGITGSD